MDRAEPLEIFLVVAPGLEPLLADEARAAGFTVTETIPGGVTLTGGWPEAWRANLVLRGATRVLVRLGSFRAFHLAQLDKRARKFDWGGILRPGMAVRVDVTTKASKIYHAKAAAQRIETALREEAKVTIDPEAAISLKVRIDDNLVTFSADTSGESLHKRGHKQAMGKAPMRETLASLFLRACGYDGAEPVVDPMSGSGTFVIEAAEIAAGLQPGRARSFAFENFAGFDSDAFAAMKTAPGPLPDLAFHGFDRDQGAVQSATANADRAGVGSICHFTHRPVSELVPPEGPPGLVIVNPPYGTRIGNKKLLFGLYGALGGRLRDGFAGWRVGIVTSDNALAKATGLPFKPAGPGIDHGGLKVRLWQTGPLKGGQ
ncbi:THUMP domain-containing class I SAM-dependent RNA methyltransferase [Mesobacterium pallidum]|uniref:THUMP domain-containing class I SAM-dependent RNA methyltransferase n=1 Tax=Mesobacterium pallidum TaxID=2872037 RepID=UPI001EE1AC96|nr:class I SAM-dependent RNA methyltransferase [Mesobacterium pallidum]